MSHLTKLVRMTLMAVVLCLAAAPAAEAVPVTGTLNIAGDVRLTSTRFDFLPPLGGGTGSFMVSPFGQTGSFAGLGSTTGSISDLSILTQPVGVPFSLPGFLTFVAAPNIRFDLTLISTGVFGSAQCFAPPAAGQTCTLPPFFGLPQAVNFTNTTTTSSVAFFSLSGLAVNTTTGETSTFVGTFSTQSPIMSYQSILAALTAQGSVTISYGAQFVVSPASQPVPEPTALMLLGTGLAGVIALSRRRRAARGREG